MGIRVWWMHINLVAMSAFPIKAIVLISQLACVSLLVLSTRKMGKLCEENKSLEHPLNHHTA